MTRIPSPERPFLKFHAVESEEPVTVGDLRFTAVPVNHTIPTHGYIVDNGGSAVVFGSDSGPTERIWDLAGRLKQLKAAFMEVGFPDEMCELANRTRHMTPGLLAREILRIDENVRVIATNIKPAFRSQVRKQLDDLKLARVDVGRPDREYRF